jgi:hypothetical protein
MTGESATLACCAQPAAATMAAAANAARMLRDRDSLVIGVTFL